MTVGVWTDGEDAPLVDAAWQRVSSLDGPLPRRLVVVHPGWTSFLSARAAVYLGDTAVVLVTPDLDDPPPRAHELAAAIVPPDPDALASAIRITDRELADAVAALDDVALAGWVFGRETPRLGDFEPLPVDLDRAARAALYESNERATVRLPLRRVLALDAQVPDRDEAQDSVVAAAAVVALLAAGMRARSRRHFRGDGSPAALPSEQSVADLLASRVSLTATGAGTTLELALADGALVVQAERAVSVSVARDGEPTWRASGTRVRIPLDRLRGDGVRLLIETAGDPSDDA